MLHAYFAEKKMSSWNISKKTKIKVRSMTFYDFFLLKLYKLWILMKIVYYKSLLDIKWRENDYNWANMTNYYLKYVKIAIWKWIVYYFSSYLHDKYCIFALIFLTTYKKI